MLNPPRDPDAEFDRSPAEPSTAVAHDPVNLTFDRPEGRASEAGRADRRGLDVEGMRNVTKEDGAFSKRQTRADHIRETTDLDHRRRGHGTPPMTTAVIADPRGNGSPDDRIAGPAPLRLLPSAPRRIGA